jgi:hypothetical protein
MEDLSTIRTVEYWENIRPGTIVQLSDTQTLLASMGTDRLQTESFTILSIMRCEELSDLCMFYICHMSSLEGEELHLVVKIVEDQVDIGIFFPISGIEPDNREGLIDDQEAFWLFQEPEDPENLDPLDLRFTTSFSLEMSNEYDGEFEVEYFQTDIGPLQTRATYTPAQPGIEDHLATIVEFWSETDKTENTRGLILEVGEEDNDQGGLVTVYIGDFLSPEIELNIMPA